MIGQLNQIVAAEHVADLRRQAESYRRITTPRRPAERSTRDRSLSADALRRMRLRIRPV